MSQHRRLEPGPAPRPRCEPVARVRTPKALAQMQKPRQRVTPAATGQVEQEYIANLQQQVYFLELELRYMHEKPELVLQRGGGGGDIGLPEDATLDDYLTSLKKKYGALEDTYKAQVDATTERVKEMEATVAKETLRREEAQQQLLREKEQVQQIRQRYEAKSSELMGDVLARDKDLDRQARHIESLERRLQSAAEDKEALTERRVDLESRISRLETALADSEAHASRIEQEFALHRQATESSEARVFELQQERKRAEEAELERRAELKEVVDAKWALTRQVQQQEVERQAVEAAKQRVEQECTQLIKTNSELRSRIDGLQQEVDEVNHALQAKLHLKDDAVADKVRLHAKIEQLQNELNQVRTQLKEKNQQLADARDEIISLQRDNEDNRVAAERQRTENSALQAAMDTLENQHNERKLAVHDLTELVTDQRHQLSQLTEQVAELEKRYQEAHLRAEEMQGRLAISSQIDKLKLDEFEQLQATNTRLAASIQSLTQQMTAYGSKQAVSAIAGGKSARRVSKPESSPAYAPRSPASRYTSPVQQPVSPDRHG